MGRLDPGEPLVVRDTRAKLRLVHYSRDTDKAYIKWLVRFIAEVGSEDLGPCGEREIESFLTKLAVEGQVAASTQNQALSALLFVFERVLGRKLNSQVGRIQERSDAAPAAGSWPRHCRSSVAALLDPACLAQPA